MKNEQSITGRHAFHNLFVEPTRRATHDKKPLIREALLQQVGRKDSQIGERAE